MSRAAAIVMSAILLLGGLGACGGDEDEGPTRAEFTARAEPDHPKATRLGA